MGYEDPQELIAIGVASDSIDDTDVDWGGGASQVNLDDVPDGSTYVRSENNLTDALKTSYDAAVTHDTAEDAINGLVKCNGTGTYSAVTDNSTNWDLAVSHITNDGSDHSLIDQDVTSGANATFGNLTITSFAAGWTNAGRTIADLGSVTTADINGGTINGVVINDCTVGLTTAAAAEFTSILTKTSQTLGKGVPMYRAMKNNSGGALAVGDCVILDTSDNTGQSVTTTTTEHHKLIFGIVTVGGNDQADVTVAVNGYAGDVAKVDGTDDIAVGDPLSTFSSAGILQKGTWAGGGIGAIALEAYSTDDSNGVIKIWVR